MVRNSFSAKSKHVCLKKMATAWGPLLVNEMSGEL